MTTFSETRIEVIVENAEQAFWAKVAEQCPEIKTGDFSPEATIEFDHACRLAITRWIEGNQPLIRVDLKPDHIRAVLDVVGPKVSEAEGTGDSPNLAEAETELDSALLAYEEGR